MYPLSLLMLVSHLVQAHPGPPCVCCQSLWIQICFGSPVFRRPVPFFPWCFHSLWLSRSFHLHFYKVILALQGEICWRPTIEYSKVFHPLHIASALGLIYCNKMMNWSTEYSRISSLTLRFMNTLKHKVGRGSVTFYDNQLCMYTSFILHRVIII